MEFAAPDRELLVTYAREGSETAFRALVARHVNLVFAAAVRQVGDSGVAEEITQNVFVALARKAPRLARHETLAGWLHRTAILEAKARIRADLRRQRREEAAAALTEWQREETSLAEDLTPLLDEGLLNLRESDRLALVLRFLEERSLREVGLLLGVDEDAARKRVSRALDRLADFFRTRGFAIPTAGSALLAQAVKAAPAGLAASASSAGLAAGGAAGGFNLVLLQLMALTKTQTAVACALLVAIPLGWQWHARSEIRQTQATLLDELAGQQSALAESDAEEVRLRAALQRAQVDTFNASARLAELEARRAAAPATPSSYQWDDASPVARIPKAMLETLPLDGVAKRTGQLSEQIRAALQFTDAEAAAVQTAINRFLDAYHSAQSAALRRVEPEERDLQGRPPEEVRVFEINGLKDAVAWLRDDFFMELNAVLDPERLQLFTRSLRNWMPVDDDPHGINTGMAVFNEDLRLRFYHYTGQTEGAPFLGYGLNTKGGSLTATIPIEEIPAFLQPPLQDWIDQVQADRAAELTRQAAGPNDPP